MAMLVELVELVVGVDTHKHTHTAAVVVAATGAMITQVTVPAAPAGYQQLLKLASQHQGQRVWAVEGTGGYGAGLTRFLAAHQEQVVELDRPKRAARRHGAKSDPAGRDQGSPRSPGPRPPRPAPSGWATCGAPGAADRAPLGGPSGHRRPAPAARLRRRRS
jgi:Transposase